MAKLEDSIDYVLKNEGGFTIDNAGPTNFGITIPDVASFREVPTSSVTEEDMKELTKIEVTEIYREEYWMPLRLDSVNDQNIATAIFDIGVNMGISKSVKYAQKTCNQMLAQLIVDGQMGSQTVDAINHAERASFISIFEAFVYEGYISMVAKIPAYSKYETGWLKRSKRLLTLI